MHTLQTRRAVPKVKIRVSEDRFFLFSWVYAGAVHSALLDSALGTTAAGVASSDDGNDRCNDSGDSHKRHEHVGHNHRWYATYGNVGSRRRHRNRNVSTARRISRRHHGTPCQRSLSNKATGSW